MFERIDRPVKQPDKKQKKPRPLPTVSAQESEPDKTIQPEEHRLPMALSVERLAEELCVSLKTAYRLVHQPGFPSLKIKGRYLVNTKRLQDWLDRHSLLTDDS